MKTRKILAQLIVIFTMALPTMVLAEQTIYLVRHAEKVASDNPDPDLTDVGHKRAEYFAEYFKDKGITHVYSTEFIRTYQTVKPAADALGLEVELYDPRKLKEFVASVIGKEGIYLIGGHSNVTPPTVNLFAGTSIPDLLDHQYDRIYKVVIGDDGKATMTISYSEPRTP
jgi:hypothetical protein